MVLSNGNIFHELMKKYANFESEMIKINSKISDSNWSNFKKATIIRYRIMLTFCIIVQPSVIELCQLNSSVEIHVSIKITFTYFDIFISPFLHLYSLNEKDNIDDFNYMMYLIETFYS